MPKRRSGMPVEYSPVFGTNQRSRTTRTQTGEKTLAPVKWNPDPVLISLVVTIVAVGIVMVASASVPEATLDKSDGFFYAIKQLQWAALGFILMWVASRYDYRKLDDKAVWIFFAGIVACLLVFSPLGVESQGARRWLGFGGQPLGQPSEFMKLALVVFMAHSLSRTKAQMGDFVKGVLPKLIITLLALLPVVKEDLGTGITMVMAVGVMFVVAGLRLSHLAVLGGTGVLGAVMLILMEPFRMNRIWAWLDPWKDPQGLGFHTIHALFSLGEGGILGAGLYLSKEKFYLPEPYTDSIFAVIGAEFGLIGTLFVLALFASLAWRGLKAAMTIEDDFGCLLATGLTGMIIMQAILNISVITGTVPFTGVPLPLISNGGSALTIALMGLGVLINLSSHARNRI